MKPLNAAERLSYPAELFGHHFPKLEGSIFDTAGQLSPEYNGGYWHFYQRFIVFST